MAGGPTGTIDWEACLARPRLAGYARQGAAVAARTQRLYVVGSESEVAYRGIDHRGRNLGMHATLRRRGAARALSLPALAPRDLPYLHRIPAGLLRAWLLPCSLLGLDDALNWVVLRGPANLAGWRLVEKRLFEHIDPGAGRWASVSVQPDYAFDIPVPSAITWQVILYDGEAARPAWQRTLDNLLGRDRIPDALRRAWA